MPNPVRVTDWGDFDWFVKTYLPRQTIPTLRSFCDRITSHTGLRIDLRSQERKAVVLEKVQAQFEGMRARNNLDQYSNVRHSCEAIGQPVARGYMPPPPPPTFGGVPAPSSSSFHHPSTYYGGGAASASGLPRSPTTATYNAGGPSRAGAGSGWGQVSTGSSIYNRNSGVHPLLDWKASPMWKPIKALTSMEMLPDITSNENSHVRRERKTTFIMPQDVVDKLRQSKSDPSHQPHYSLRLFCTSSDHYRPPGSAYNPQSAYITNTNVPIEYPGNPDALADEYPLPFKEKGLRGKAGSAPPLDLDRSSRGLVLQPGRMTSVVLGHTGPTVGKKKENAKRFWYQVVFAEMTRKEELLDRLNRLPPTPAAEALAMTRKESEDDDIVVGTSMMSLKDPLSYMRIKRPVRSGKCTHQQCFDAQWWIESNSVHPQWLCPLCNKELKFEQLIVDGYVLDILNAAPESVEEVVLESSGEWHTEDNKFGSPDWLAQHRPAANGNPSNGHASEPPREDTASEPSAASPVKEESPAVKGKRKAIEILSDSEDEDDQPLSRTNQTSAMTSVTPAPNGNHQPPPPSVPPPPRPPTSRAQSSASVQASNAVIDLTLDSSDEEGDEDDEDDEDETHFRQPGDGSIKSDAADLKAPMTTMKTSEGSVARLNGHGMRPYVAPPPPPQSWKPPARPDIPGVYKPPAYGANRGGFAEYGRYTASGDAWRREDDPRMAAWDAYRDTPPGQRRDLAGMQGRGWQDFRTPSSSGTNSPRLDDAGAASKRGRYEYGRDDYGRDWDAP